MLLRLLRPRRALVGVPLSAILLTGASLALARSVDRGTAFQDGGPARCLPNALDVSAVLPGTTLSVSPLPGSRDAAPATQISMVGVPSAEIRDVSVRGSQTGSHAGHLIAYSQRDGASFLPDAAFAPGETVEVRGRLVRAGTSKPFQFLFSVERPDPITMPVPTSKIRLAAGEYQSFQSAPALHPPTIAVTTDAPVAGRGDIFLAPYSGPGNDGPMIFEPDGQLVWEDPLPENIEATNLQVQRLEGRPVLTWWQGLIPQNGFGAGEEIVDDTSYRTIMRVRAGNGYRADLHDFRIEPNDTAVLTVFDTIDCDLSSIGGPREGDVTDALYQEVDLRTGLVRREWTSIDHVPLRASYAVGTQASSEWPYDYFHLNTVEPLADGATLLSARNTSQVYLIDSRSGQIETAIGGRAPTVKGEPGTATAYQHDATDLGNGEVSLFDNGGAPFEHAQSRALVLKLDAEAGTVAKVAEMRHPEALKSPSQGSVQRLPGGSWFVGWGQEPYVSEFSPAGKLLYDAHMPQYTNSYRAYELPWSATPTWPPAIAVKSSGARLTVYASWNGATAVRSWRVLAGPSPRTLATVGGAPRSGFQTAVTVKSAAGGYVAVEALDSDGHVIGRSKALRA